MDDTTLYDTPNGKKTLAQMAAELQIANPGGNYTDPATVIATYNSTVSGSKTGGSGNPAQDLLDAIASGDQTKFDEAVREYNQTNYTNLATSLLGTSAQLRGPEDYFKFNQYTSGGRNLWEQLFGSQPRPDFSAPTGPITPVTINSVMQALGMIPATAAPTTVDPNAPAGSVPANALSPQSVSTPAAPVTPLSGVAAAVSPPPAPVPTIQNIGSNQPGGGTTLAPTLPPTPITGLQPLATTATPTATTASQPTMNTGFRPPSATTTTGNQPIPLPYQINPAVWDSMGPTGQSLALAAAEAAGWDKNEYLRQINAARPQGTAPGASSTAFRTPMGAFS
jgi:hypothetical protein